MATKIYSFLTMAVGVATTVMLIIIMAMGDAVPFRLPFMSQLTCCMATGAITLLCVRFNIVGLRHDMTERLIVPNTALFLVSCYMVYLGIRHFAVIPDIVNYIVLGGLIGLFIIVFITYWAVRRRRGY